MKPDPKKILADALRLDASSRALIAESLLESLDFDEDIPISEAWKAEIDRRCQDIDAGRVELIEGDEVLAELRAKFSR